MEMRRGVGVRPLIPAMSRLLLLAGGLVLLVGITLNLLPEQTARFFAWTIDPPLTAAFLGGGYWSSFALEYLAARHRVWARSRIAVPAVFVFTTLTLTATLLHIDRFHLGGDFEAITRIGTWTWTVFYAIVPPLLLLLWIVQLRVPGGDPSRVAPIAGWTRVIIGIQAVGLLG